MKNFILFFLILFLSLFSVSVSYTQVVQEYSTGNSTLELKGGELFNISTGKPIYKFVKNTIKDGVSGKNLYTVIDGVLKSFATKKNLYKYENGLIIDFATEDPLYVIETGVIKSWSMGIGFYRIVGNFGAGELYMVLLATGLL